MQNTRQLLVILASLAAVLLLAACAPIITVSNKTPVGIRAVVMPPGQSTQIVSVTAGESSGVESAENGAYTVVVIQDQEWIEWAKATRQYLNDRLAHSDELTGEQLLDVIRRLKDIATRMDAYEKIGTSGSACSGTITDEGGGLVEVSQGADGNLVVACR